MTAIQETIETRLAKLKHDYEQGHAQLQDLVRQESALREILLRMSGAIQVLEEILSGEAGTDNDEDAEPKVLHVP